MEIQNIHFSENKNESKKQIFSVLDNNLSSFEKKVVNSPDQKKIFDFYKENKKLPFDLNPQEIVHLQKNKVDTWFEYLSFRYKFKNNPSNRIVSEFPLYVLIEPVSTCNLRCTMCFQIDKTFTRKPYMGLMNIDFYKKIIDECHKEGTKAITFASRGEPTLHPKLPEMISYAKNKFLEVKLNTNATRLNEKLIRSILENGVNELTYSVDESDKEKFEKIRVNANFDQIVQNVKLFKEIREKEFPNSVTTTRISGVLVEKDQDIEVISNFWKKYVDHVVFVKCQNRWDTYNNEIDEIESPCNFLWERFYVWFDGKTNPCDVDYKSLLSPGKLDYEKNTIKEIWHSELLTKLRTDHLEGKRKNYNPCDRCSMSF